MGEFPEKLDEMATFFDMIRDRTERIEALMSMADRFESVPAEIAERPFPKANRVKACESEAYVWAKEQQDGNLKFYFAVENPQGISAMATAVVLDETLSGAPVEEVAEVPTDVIYKFFGSELSMGKSMGLMAMVDMVRLYARKHLEAQGGTV